MSSSISNSSATMSIGMGTTTTGRTEFSVIETIEKKTKEIDGVVSGEQGKQDEQNKQDEPYNEDDENDDGVEGDDSYNEDDESDDDANKKKENEIQETNYRGRGRGRARGQGQGQSRGRGRARGRGFESYQRGSFRGRFQWHETSDRGGRGRGGRGRGRGRGREYGQGQTSSGALRYSQVEIPETNPVINTDENKETDSKEKSKDLSEQKRPTKFQYTYVNFVQREYYLNKDFKWELFIEHGNYEPLVAFSFRIIPIRKHVFKKNGWDQLKEKCQLFADLVRQAAPNFGLSIPLTSKNCPKLVDEFKRLFPLAADIDEWRQNSFKTYNADSKPIPGDVIMSESDQKKQFDTWADNTDKRVFDKCCKWEIYSTLGKPDFMPVELLPMAPTNPTIPYFFKP